MVYFEAMTVADSITDVGARRVRMTEAEFLALDEKRVEWVEGEVVCMSPVSISHSMTVIWLVRLMARLTDRGMSGVVLSEVAVRTGLNTDRVPDVCFISAKNARRMKATYIDGPPDLVVEVVSAESRARDYRVKYAEYLSAGVQEYWIVDPLYQAVDAHRLVEEVGAGKYVPIIPVAVDGAGEGGEIRSEVLPGFVLRPEWLKQTPLPVGE